MQVKSLKSLLIPIVILVLGVLAMRSLTAMREEVPARPPEEKTRVVTVTTVQPATIAANIVAWGRLESAQPLVLLAEGEGVLEAGDVPFQQGQSFSRGELLLKVDDRQKRLELKRNKSDFINAMAAVLPDIQQQYPKEWRRWNSYFNKLQVDKALPEMPAAEVEKIKRLLARYNAYQLYYAVRIEEIALQKYNIRAPFDGTILGTDLRIGANVRSGTRLGEILNLEELDLIVQMPVADLPWLDPDGEVEVRSSQFAGSWSGHIDRIGRHVNETTQTVPVYVRLQGKEAELPAMAGLLFEALLPGKSIENAVSVPLKNIYGSNDVYLLIDGRLEKRSVDISRREAERAIITGGLNSGEQLVTDLLQGIAPGMKAMTRQQFQQRASQS